LGERIDERVVGGTSTHARGGWGRRRKWGGMLADVGRNGCSNGKEEEEMEAKKEENLGDG
jgi:hypothetical protein